MQLALAATALLMGIAGSPHCVAMCAAACRGAACAAAPGTRPGVALVALLGGRLLGYAAGGAVVAASASLLGQWSGALPWLRPWWAILHVAALALGLWLLWRGQQPRWLRTAGQGVVQKLATIAPPATRRPGHRGIRWHAWRPVALGTLWVAWPCGLLQSALLVAALSGGPAEGALSMALFAAGSSLGLLAAPQLFGRLIALAPGAAVRLAGAALAAASGWALWHSLQRDAAAAFCA